VVPDAYQVAGLEAFLDRPTRKRRTVHAENARAFAIYFNRHARPESAIYATMAPHYEVRGVINDHAPGSDGEAGWRDHGVQFAVPYSVRWKRWLARAGDVLTQRQFAELIEDLKDDVTDPSPATMMSVATNLRMQVNGRTGSSVNLSNASGDLQISAENTSTTSDGLVVPAEFTIAVPIFQGEPPYRVTIRLRHGPGEEGKGIQYRYEIANREEVEEAAFHEVLAAIQNGRETDDAGDPLPERRQVPVTGIEPILIGF